MVSRDWSPLDSDTTANTSFLAENSIELSHTKQKEKKIM
jgi:hypothetical protein